MILDSIERLGVSDPLPEATEVVVIGGGIAGITAALFLAEAGVSVLVCEKGLVGAEQSGRNWGWVRQMGRDPAEIPLSIESLKLWREINGRFGIETGFRETGITYVCRTAAEIRHFTEASEQGRAANLQSEILDAAGLARLLPGVSPRYTMGLHTASDGRAEPLRAVPEMARAARRLGAKIVENCAVRGIETSAGHLSAVVTEKGTVRCETAIVAGGIWSRLFLGNLGIAFPQLRILGTAARVEADGDLPAMPVGGGDFAFRRRLDGGYTVALRNMNVAPITPDSFRLFGTFLPSYLGSWREVRLRFGRQFFTEMATARHWPPEGPTPFEAERTMNPAPTEGYNRKALVNLVRAFPAFAGARQTHSWAGMIDSMPDTIPVIGPVDGTPGLFISSGYSGHGFGIGPGAGRLASDLVRGRTPVVDPAPFRLGRFGRVSSAAA